LVIYSLIALTAVTVVVRVCWFVLVIVNDFLVEIHLQFLHIVYFVTHWQSLFSKTEEIKCQQIFSTKVFTPQAVSITSSPIKDKTPK